MFTSAPFTAGRIARSAPTRPELQEAKVQRLLQEQLDADTTGAQPGALQVRRAAPWQLQVTLHGRTLLLDGPVRGVYFAPGAMLDFTAPQSRRTALAALGARLPALPAAATAQGTALLTHLSACLGETVGDAGRPPTFLDLQRPQPLWLLLQPETDGQLTLHAGVHRLCTAQRPGPDGNVHLNGLTGETLTALTTALRTGLAPLGYRVSVNGLKYALPPLPGSAAPQEPERHLSSRRQGP